jgi:voltage-gated potassium channel Kch
MNEKIRWLDRAKYWFDELFSKGTAALAAMLGIFSLTVVGLIALVVWMTGLAPDGEEPLTFLEAFWMSLMRSLDAGTMGGDTGWGFRLAMLLVTFGGIFVLSSFIGVLTTGIEARIEQLRKGRSRVIEQGHTVILGWSEQIFTIINELVVANSNLPRSCLVILADKDKVEMEEEISDKVEKTGRTKIVCRSGSPTEMTNLNLLSLNTCKAIIVLSPESEDPDSEVIKTVLAITNHPNRRSLPYHIVAELRDPKNMDIARVVGKQEVEWMLVGDLVARVIAQTCRQSGLSVIYTELLDFEGDEIYFTLQPELVGKTYGDALLAYKHNTVIGLMPAGKPATLNPPMQTIIEKDDQIILIAEDDNKIQYQSPEDAVVQTDAILSPSVHSLQPERTLILGWNWRLPTILCELDHYVAPESRVTIVADIDQVGDLLANLENEMQNQTLDIRRGDTTDRRELESLNLGRYNHVILLCYSDTLSAQQADARTLVTLLHLRDIADKQNLHYSIVSEMLDIRNRNLADITRADDFIVSDKLVSLLLAQVAENKALNTVFSDLFAPEGAEIYLKPAQNYLRLGEPVNFYTIVAAARSRGETAFGYRIKSKAQNASEMYGVVFNPNRDDTITFQDGDTIIVLSEN